MLLERDLLSVDCNLTLPSQGFKSCSWELSNIEWKWKFRPRSKDSSCGLEAAGSVTAYLWMV